MSELSDPLLRVRRSCARIGAQARHASVGPVHRLVEEIETLFLSASEHRAAAWSYDTKYHYAPHDPSNPEAKARAATYVLVLAAINYGSGYAPWLRRDPANSTYYTLSGRLAEAFDRDRLYDPDVLMRLDVANVARVFGQDRDDEHVYPFLAKLRQSLHEIGAFIREQTEPTGLSFLQNAGFDAKEIVSQLIAVPTFDDCCPVEDVFFYKKAQLFVADIARLGVHYGWWTISGVEQLTLFADNAVAQVLRVLGVIELSGDLAERIDADIPLPVCSMEEIEIRACTINAGQMLIEKIRGNNPDRALDIVEIDYYLWHISHDVAYYRHKNVKRHRSLGQFY